MLLYKTVSVLLTLTFMRVAFASHQSSLPPPPTRIEDTTPYPAVSDQSIRPLTPLPQTATKHHSSRVTSTEGRNVQQSTTEASRQGRGILEMGGAISRVVSAIMGVALRAAGETPQQKSRPFASPAAPTVQGPSVAETPAGRLAGVITAALHLLGVRAQTLSNVAVNGIIYIAQMIANAFAIPTPTPTTYHPPPPRKKQGSGKRRGPDVQGQGQGQNQRQRPGQNKRRGQRPVKAQAQQHSTDPVDQNLRNRPTAKHRDQQETQTYNSHLQQTVTPKQDGTGTPIPYHQQINFVPVQPPKRGFIHRKDFLQSNNIRQKADYRREEDEKRFVGQDLESDGDVNSGQPSGQGGEEKNDGEDGNEEWPKYEDPDGPDLLQWLMMQQKNSGKGRALVEEASRPGLGWRAAAALPASNPCVRLLVCSLAPVVSAMQRALRPAFAAHPSGEQGNYSMPRAATLAAAADNCEARYPQCKPLDAY